MLVKITLAANVPQKRVEWHLPAKVRLKKSHFGKPPLTECVLRPPPCQSELAEASTTFYGTPRAPSKTKATGRPSARAKMPDSPASRQYTLRAMPSSATMEGTISSEMERSVRRVSFAESNNKNTLLQEMEKRHEHGVYITKKRCAELDGAARLRLNFCD